MVNTDKAKFLIVAGEASGDRHAARLVTAMRASARNRDLEFFGAAGPKMRDVGVEAVVESDELAIVGVLEIAKALPMFLSAFRRLSSAAMERKPDMVILVDFPDFNLRLAKYLKKQGLKVVYFISPQLWAWRSHRVKAIEKYVDILLTILPFEKEWYSQRGFKKVEFVGNPLANEVRPTVSRKEFGEKHSLDPAKQIVAMLPGSRQKEIVRILPVMLRAAELISKEVSNVQFTIAVRSGRNRVDAENLLAQMKPAATVRVVADETYDALAASDAAIVTSGTATLEAGIIGVPMVIVYRSSLLNYILLKPLISVEHIGLINLIAGKRIATEMVQNEFSPDSAAAEVLRLLDPVENRRVRAELSEAAKKLGEGGASERAAEVILAMLDRRDA